MRRRAGKRTEVVRCSLRDMRASEAASCVQVQCLRLHVRDQVGAQLANALFHVVPTVLGVPKVRFPAASALPKLKARIGCKGESAVQSVLRETTRKIRLHETPQPSAPRVPGPRSRQAGRVACRKRSKERPPIPWTRRHCSQHKPARPHDRPPIQRRAIRFVDGSRIRPHPVRRSFHRDADLRNEQTGCRAGCSAGERADPADQLRQE